jgi:hypothetical protein
MPPSLRSAARSATRFAARSRTAATAGAAQAQCSCFIPKPTSDQLAVAMYVGGWAAFSAVSWELYPKERASSMVWALTWPCTGPYLLMDMAWKMDEKLRPW